MEQYKAWLTACAGDKTKARCKLCVKSIDISNMGEAALKSHSKGAVHQQKVKLTAVGDNPPIALFMASANTASTSGSVAANFVAASKTAAVSASVRSVTHFVEANEVQSAEILWVLNTVMSHMSFSSSSGISALFQQMFHDSQIAAKFSCNETKCSYICRFGLAPYFSNLLHEQIKICDEFVVLFDEILNKATYTKQMDFHVRFWQANGEVKTRYLAGFLQRPGIQGRPGNVLEFQKWSNCPGNVLDFILCPGNVLESVCFLAAGVAATVVCTTNCTCILNLSNYVYAVKLL
jgi:hypothetical protein